VRDKGRGRFSYVLVDNCYHLQASNKRSKVLPLAYVQISSEYLSSVGVEQAEQSLRYVVNTLGLVNEPANISRVDLFVDFMAELRMDIQVSKAKPRIPSHVGTFSPIQKESNGGRRNRDRLSTRGE